MNPVTAHRVRDQAVTIRVRMTKGQLKDLIGKVDTSNDKYNLELGDLIVQECSKGRLRARVVAAAAAADGGHHHSYKFSRGQANLLPIQEHSILV